MGSLILLHERPLVSCTRSLLHDHALVFEELLTAAHEALLQDCLNVTPDETESNLHGAARDKLRAADQRAKRLARGIDERELVATIDLHKLPDRGLDCCNGVLAFLKLKLQNLRHMEDIPDPN